MRYCARCVYPEIAVNLDVDEEGVCSACRAHEVYDELGEEFWAQRRKKFEQILEENLKGDSSNYD